MKARSRRHGAAIHGATADLFAPQHPPATPPILRAAPPPGAVPAEQRPRARQLWHAVVFPELPEPQAAALLQRLCLTAQRFTSLVSIEMPNALLLEVNGSVRLFGSLGLLQAALLDAWNRLPWRTLTATAPSPVAALWFARAGKSVCIEDPSQLAGSLAEVPIACTSWDAEWLQTLHAMGVRRLGDLLRLPRDGVARRLGPAAIRDLDAALARQAAPRKAFVPRRRFRERRDFEAEISNVEYLQQALEPLLERCAQFLRQRQAGIQALQLTLRHRALPATCVRVGLAGITSERRRLADVLAERLQRLELTAPVRGMELRSGALLPLPADSLDAFAGHRGSGSSNEGLAGHAAPQLVERLRARLGDGAIYSVCAVPEHRPEAAWQKVHELMSGSAGAMPVPDMPRPVWLLDEPLKLSATLEGLLSQGVRLEAGPERIESGWWDGKGVARDYYSARRMHGARWWIFQERHDKSWFLHGLFA